MKKKIPFPQANNMELIFNAFFDIGPDGVTASDIANKYGLTVRQGSYYLASLAYLGLAEKFNVKYFLTEKGVSVRLESSDDTRKAFCQIVENVPFLNSLFKDFNNICKEERKAYTSGRIFNEMGLSTSTANRRASTVVAWYDWLMLQK